MNPLVNILDGNTFLVSDRQGDVDPSPVFPTGLFSYDTRFLSVWQLTINGDRLTALSVDDLQYYESRFFLVPGEPTHYVDTEISAIRHRSIGGSFVEDLAVLNEGNEPVDLVVRVEMGADFADLFDVKNPTNKVAPISVVVQDGLLCFAYRRGSFQRETVVSSSVAGDVDEHGMTFRIRIPAHAEWRTRFHVATNIVGAQGHDFRDSLRLHRPRSATQIGEALSTWLSETPRLISDNESITTAYRRSLTDLAALRYTSVSTGTQLVAAGLPWFMTLFGRDSLFTCLQSLSFLPHLAPPIITTLALTQGSRFDDFRDEEPGKILHELRYGESAAFGEQPHSPYFGSADSTMLFVILLDEYHTWTGDDLLPQRFEMEARAALDWIDTYGDLLGTGYVWYQTRNPDTGLQNQCWKDSWDSISYADGRLPGFPRATCELQGYAYDAKMRGARLARLVWNDPAYAQRLEQEAADLKARFNRDFWVDDGRYYALALDAEGRQVDALSSNIGHLLWSGIVDEQRASDVAAHLLGPRMFSGWGIRTLATGNGRYNGLGYHVGTVWPFDNSIIAWGLWRYGFREEAGVICQAMFDAARYFEGRLPEAFAGYDRERTKYPVQYPTACSPQAWSAATPLLLIRVILGLQPHGNHLVVDPALPSGTERIELLDIPGRWGRVDALGRRRPDTNHNERGIASAN